MAAAEGTAFDFDFDFDAAVSSTLDSTEEDALEEMEEEVATAAAEGASVVVAVVATVPALLTVGTACYRSSSKCVHTRKWFGIIMIRGHISLLALSNRLTNQKTPAFSGLKTATKNKFY